MPSNTSIKIVENWIELYARNHAAITHTAKSVIAGCDKYPVAPVNASSFVAKWVKPVTPAMPMNIYAQIKHQPDRPPVLGPSPFTVYSYILPAEVYRRLNWFRLNAT